MAKIIIENATVERVFHTQNGSTGVSLSETYTPEHGEPRKSWFTAWFQRDPRLEVGQLVSVSGFHGAKVRKYESNGETRYSADVSVNSARVIESAPPIAPAPSVDDLAWSDQPSADDAWGWTS